MHKDFLLTCGNLYLHIKHLKLPNNHHKLHLSRKTKHKTMNHLIIVLPILGTLGLLYGLQHRKPYSSRQKIPEKHWPRNDGTILQRYGSSRSETSCSGQRASSTKWKIEKMGRVRELWMKKKSEVEILEVIEEEG